MNRETRWKMKIMHVCEYIVDCQSKLWELHRLGRHIKLKTNVISASWKKSSFYVGRYTHLKARSYVSLFSCLTYHERLVLELPVWWRILLSHIENARYKCYTLTWSHPSLDRRRKQRGKMHVEQKILLLHRENIYFQAKQN